MMASLDTDSDEQFEQEEEDREISDDEDFEDTNEASCDSELDAREQDTFLCSSKDEELAERSCGDLIQDHLRGSLSFGLAKKETTNLMSSPKLQYAKKTSEPYLSDELQYGSSILLDLMSESLKNYNLPFLASIDINSPKTAEYKEVIKKPLWLGKIKENLHCGVYPTITELVADIRLMLENAYRYNGPVHSITKKGMRMEFILEQKISILPSNLMEKCSLKATSGIDVEALKETMKSKSSKLSINGYEFRSYLLHRVRGCRAQRDKELKLRKLDAIRKARQEKELEVIEWERSILDVPDKMEAMWELPQIGQFIFLALNSLNISEVPQYELERILLLPAASSTLAMLMTSLLSSPQQRPKLCQNPYMPYKIWAQKLAQKVHVWYKFYIKENRNAEKVFETVGIEPLFWKVCGEKNPFHHTLFHEMTFHQRVWLLKTLCDYVFYNHKSVQETVGEQNELDQRECLLGEDRDGYQYLHFPQFCGTDLRIYKKAPVVEPMSLHITETEPEVHMPQRKIFSADKIREFKRLMRKLKKSLKNDSEWNGYRKRKRRSKSRARLVEPMNQTILENRSRPGNLRQCPRTRYTEDLPDFSSDEEFCMRVFPRKRSVPLPPSSDEDEPASLLQPESIPCIPPDQPKLEPLPKQTPNVRRRPRRQSRKCEICGKIFSNAQALYGHMAMHYRKRNGGSREGTPVSFKSEVKTEMSKECSRDIKASLPLSATNEIKNETESKLQMGVVKKEDDISTGPSFGSEVDNIKKKEDVKIEGGNEESHVDPENESISIPLNGDREEESVDSEEFIFRTMEEQLRKLDSFENSCEGDRDELQSKRDSENASTVNASSLPSSVSNCIVNSCHVSDSELESTHAKSEDKTGDLDTTCKMPEEWSDSERSSSSENDIHDPSPYSPSVENFQLIVSSIDELRALISQFGTVPKKEKDALKAKSETADSGEEANRDDDFEEKDTDEEGTKAGLPECEAKLYIALCNLMKELLPWENKLSQATRRMRNKLRNEFFEYQSRGPDYVDPAEEAWLSDPEPEPEHPPAPAEPPEESSSSEDSFDEEGNCKRKLRNRKMKRQAPPPEPLPVEEPLPDDDSSETFSISSRGRIRKVRKITDYDAIDFDALADEAQKEKNQKKKMEEEEMVMKDRQFLRDNDIDLEVPPCGIKRYMLSDAGQVIGFIDNEGKVHRATLKPKDRSGNWDARVTGSSLASGIRPAPDSDLPSVTVSAVNKDGTPVYIKVMGDQALLLVKYIRPGANSPSQIKLQHFDQTYVVNTNAHVILKNVPGFPDGELNEKVAPSRQQKLAEPSRVSQTSSFVPAGVPPASAVVSTCTNTVPAIQNTIALAYRGLPNGTSVPLDVGRLNMHPQPAHTNLVSARTPFIPSTTPIVPTTTAAASSIIPPEPSRVVMPPISPAGPPAGVATAARGQTPQMSQTVTMLVPGPGGAQFRVRMDSVAANQIMQKPGKLVVVPNNKGGYVLSMAPVTTKEPVQLNKAATVVSAKSPVMPALPVVSQTVQSPQQSAGPPNVYVQSINGTRMSAGCEALPASAVSTAQFVQPQQGIATHQVIPAQQALPSQILTSHVIQTPQVIPGQQVIHQQQVLPAQQVISPSHALTSNQQIISTSQILSPPPTTDKLRAVHYRPLFKRECPGQVDHWPGRNSDLGVSTGLFDADGRCPVCLSEKRHSGHWRRGLPDSPAAAFLWRSAGFGAQPAEDGHCGSLAKGGAPGISSSQCLAAAAATTTATAGYMRTTKPCAPGVNGSSSGIVGLDGGNLSAGRRGHRGEKPREDAGRSIRPVQDDPGGATGPAVCGRSHIPSGAGPSLLSGEERQCSGRAEWKYLVRSSVESDLRNWRAPFLAVLLIILFVNVLTFLYAYSDFI